MKPGKVTIYLPASCSGRMDNSGSYADINSNVCLSVSCTDMSLGWTGLVVLKPGQVSIYLPVSCSGRMDNSGSYADINSNICLPVS